MKTSIRAMLVMAMIGVATNSYATSTVTNDTNLTVSLELTSACTISVTNTGGVTSPALSTGTGVLTSNIGTVNIADCTATYKLGADKGGHWNAAGGGAARNVQATVLATNYFVPYTLGISGTPITTIPNTSDWGSSDMTTLANKTTGTTAASTATATGTALTPDTYTISARFVVPVSTTAPVGTYSDSVVVAVEF